MESHAATSPNTEPATKTHPSLLFQFFVISTLLCMVNALRNSEVSWQNFLWLYISIYVNVWMLWKHAHSQCIQFGYSGQSLGILHRQAAAKPCTSAVLEQGQRWRPPLWAPLGELPSFLIVPDRTEAHGRLQVEQWQPASSTTLTECIPYKLQVTIMTITKADLLPWKCSESLDHMLIINDMSISIMVYLSKCHILLIHLYTYTLDTSNGTCISAVVTGGGGAGQSGGKSVFDLGVKPWISWETNLFFMVLFLIQIL